MKTLYTSPYMQVWKNIFTQLLSFYTYPHNTGSHQNQCWATLYRNKGPSEASPILINHIASSFSKHKDLDDSLFFKFLLGDNHCYVL
jgi:hypothetical protein